MLNMTLSRRKRTIYLLNWQLGFLSKIKANKRRASEREREHLSSADSEIRLA